MALKPSRFLQRNRKSGSRHSRARFCPAVGVSESAAAGTTNAVLSSYLVRHGLLTAESDIITLNAEQGIELGRPSSIQSVVTMSDRQILRLQVGGVATRVLDGKIHL